MRVRVDPTKCSGIGLCEMTAPVVFEIGDDGQSHVLVEDPEGGDYAAAVEAESNCPARAISVEE
ncbi:3Fe-4S ferredoxin [Mycobacteroides abscessus subsp. bolletii]|uniref:3Fe-4S ferredoxin n=3 Tax=Mycobacteroides abscessus TaxID=36809 RepID=A0A9Q7SHS5_9MYCO|nr:ferredoxin [Mycobacteroides abscessus]EUA71842.1 ferredoxin [Mycobacteroides abscessus subsp. bolletii 1513]EIU10420.1 ferredoxin reductase [Mycobacteroides abscessus 5S-0304]EIU16486.1 ferredoxin reductase [Mycobacteroides abscessus 5S-0421]EIU19203.1 ferredoxin reductase [Mycobacteroides abscessus 5S-0422]EIU32516.1 ferredoxin reductase [Mycobacteroides abscessus 5S-0708]